MINLRSENDIHILVGVPKEKLSPLLIQKDHHVEEEPQYSIVENIGENNNATISVKKK